MPIIQAYQRKQSIPGVSGGVVSNPAGAGVVGDAATVFGKTGMNAVDELVPIIARRNEEMRQQNNAMAVLKAQNAIDADMRAFKQTYDIEANKGNFDPAGLQDFTKTTVDKFKTDLDIYLEKVSDPQQRIHIETYRNAAINHVLDHTSVYQANARKDFAKVETLKSTDLAAQNARDGIVDLETAINSNREKLGVLHATGAISATDMEEIIIKADRQIAASYLDGLIARDPLKAIDEIKSGKYNQFLPEGQYRHFMGKAETIGKEIEKKTTENNGMKAILAENTDAATGKVNIEKAIMIAQTADKVGGVDLTKLDQESRRSLVASLNNIEKAQTEKNAQNGYGTLFSAYSGDPQSMRKALLTPETAKTLGLDMKDVNAVNGLINDLEKVKTADYEATGADYLKRIQARTLKATDVLNDLNAGKIDQKGAAHWLDEINKHRDVVTDPVAAVTLLDKILKNRPGTPGAISATEIIRAPGIAYKEKESLLTKFYAEMNGEQNSGEKDAKDYLKSQLISTGLMGKPVPKQFERLYNAYETLDQEAAAARKAGKVWSASDYLNRAKSLATSYWIPTSQKIQEETEIVTGIQPPAPVLKPGGNTPKKRLTYDVKTGIMR